jgi:hypothetical protein
MFTLQQVSDYLWPHNPFKTLERGYITGTGSFHRLTCIKNTSGYGYSDEDLLIFSCAPIEIKIKVKHVKKYRITSSLIEDPEQAKKFRMGMLLDESVVKLIVPDHHKMIVDLDSSKHVKNLTITRHGAVQGRVEKGTLEQYKVWLF